MIKIGITGQSGFIGTHLYNTLGLYPEKFERIPFEDRYFESPALLERFVMRCEVVVHLAAMNRHNDPEILYQTNILLVKKLISACQKSGSTPHILFSSSSQEERDNLYGKSKREGRRLLERWADKNSASFSGLIIPNVFGPFGNPFYNSVVATFCHQLTHGGTPRIESDAEMKLIYVAELVHIFITCISKIHADHQNDCVIEEITIPGSITGKVSVLLKLLTSFQKSYFEQGAIPSLDAVHEKDLFNTFLTYIDHATFFPFPLRLNSDARGTFVETMKLHSGGQVSFSTTLPGITRGNHFHTRKAERFAVIKGKAQIALRRIGTSQVHTFLLDGSKPAFVDMPIWHTHNITNIGDEELTTLFWINEHFNPADPDTYYEQV